MKLLGSNKSKMTKNENDKNAPHLGIIEVVLVRCNIVSSNYQQNLRDLYTFIPNKPFGQLLDISPLKLLTQNFHKLNYGLQIKTINR